MNERGHYGKAAAGKGGGSVAIVIGIAAAIYALSPGARHYYKYGSLPRQR